MMSSRLSCDFRISLVCGFKAHTRCAFCLTKLNQLVRLCFRKLRYYFLSKIWDRFEADRWNKQPGKQSASQFLDFLNGFAFAINFRLQSWSREIDTCNATVISSGSPTTPTSVCFRELFRILPCGFDDLSFQFFEVISLFGNFPIQKDGLSHEGLDMFLCHNVAFVFCFRARLGLLLQHLRDAKPLHPVSRKRPRTNPVLSPLHSRVLQLPQTAFKKF